MQFKRKLSLRAKLVVTIVSTIAVLLPFANKAFHIDDTTFVYCARQILKTPLACYSDATTNWFGTLQSLWLFSDSPITTYYMALVMKLVGEKEVWLHISYLIFPIISIISMYFLGKRFTDEPILSTLLLVSTPAFMVSATNIMPDIALLAFYLGGTCLFIYGLDMENNMLLAIAGFVMGFACLAKYNGLTIIPLLPFYATLKRKFSKCILPLSICLILVGLWCVHNLIFLNMPHIVMLTLDKIKPTFLSMSSNLLGTFSFMGGVTIFPILFILLFKRKKDFFTYLFIVWLIFLILGYFIQEYNLTKNILAIFFISIASFFLWKCMEFLKNTIADRIDTIFLLVWLMVVFCGNVIVISWFAAARYALILTPVLILLFLKIASATSSRRNFFTPVIYIGIILNFMVSISVVHGDYIYANIYRDFTRTYAKYLKEKDYKVWFRGHWGFQYYMEKEGFAYLGLEDMPKKGETIITPHICDDEPFSKPLKEKVKFIGTIKYETPYPIRTISPKDRINFYAYTIGSLPYGVSNEPLEVFQIWQAE